MNSEIGAKIELPIKFEKQEEIEKIQKEIEKLVAERNNLIQQTIDNLPIKEKSKVIVYTTKRNNIEACRAAFLQMYSFRKHDLSLPHISINFCSLDKDDKPSYRTLPMSWYDGETVVAFEEGETIKNLKKFCKQINDKKHENK